MIVELASARPHGGQRGADIVVFRAETAEILRAVLADNLNSHQAELLPEYDTNVRLGPHRPPLVNRGRIAGGSSLPLFNARVFARRLAVAVIATALRSHK